MPLHTVENHNQQSHTILCSLWRNCQALLNLQHQSKLYYRQHPLHSILYLMLSKNKIFYKYSNSMTGLIINFYNFFSIMLSYNYMNNNQILLTILIINIITYLFVYFKLLNILSNRFVSKK